MYLNQQYNSFVRIFINSHHLASYPSIVGNNILKLVMLKPNYGIRTIGELFLVAALALLASNQKSTVMDTKLSTHDQN